MRISKVKDGYVGYLKMGKWFCIAEGKSLECVCNKLFEIAETTKRRGGV